MGNSLSCDNYEKRVSYQHLHGIMLVNLNRITYDLKLTHAEYHLMGVLIGYWNKQQGKSFPTTRMLAKQARMGNSTVIKCLKTLSNLNLLIIIKDGKTKRQTYYLNTKKLIGESNNFDSPKVTRIDSTCSNNINKHKRTRTIKKKSSLKNQNNDDVINLSKTKKEILAKLRSWNYSKPHQLLKDKEEEKIIKAIKEVEIKAPRNPGAYFRTLISIESINRKSNKPVKPIQEMIKHKHWRHKPTGNKLQVLPDIGNHLLVKYFEKENMIMFYDTGFTDKLSAFEPFVS